MTNIEGEHRRQRRQENLCRSPYSHIEGGPWKGGEEFDDDDNTCYEMMIYDPVDDDCNGDDFDGLDPSHPHIEGGPRFGFHDDEICEEEVVCNEATFVSKDSIVASLLENNWLSWSK